MTGVSTGIGLMSGIDHTTLINQLMEIEARPVRLLEERVQQVDARHAAYLDISARLLAVQNAALRFTKSSLFRTFAANSSNESVLTASAGETAIPGSYTFNVHRLVANHALISRGFADADATPVGAGTLSLEIGNGRINRGTQLDALNGGEGVRRGTIAITDRSGQQAQIDLSTAMTVDELLEAINGNTEINVRASVTSLEINGKTGDRVVLEDLSGGTGYLIVADVAGGSTAADLGIVGSEAGGRIDGHDLIYLTEDSALTTLNDGIGIGRRGQHIPTGDLEFDAGALGSFTVSLSDVLAADTSLDVLNSGGGVRLGTIRITDRTGESAEIDLSTATTVQDVLDAINEADVGVHATTVNSRFLITDDTGVAEEIAQDLTIEDVTGFAAADLGIAGSDTDESISGRDVYRIATIGDVIRAINQHPDNNSLVRAFVSQDGNALMLRALGFTTEPITVTSSEGSTAARDLGIEGASFEGGVDFRSRDLVAGLNTALLSSLNGGQGIEPGTIAFTVGNQPTQGIDFTGAHTLRDVIDLINNADLGLVASMNGSGNKLELRQAEGSTGTLVIADVDSAMAATLGIAGTFEESDLSGDGAVVGDNLQLQYISRQSLLEDLNHGRGVASGRFRVTDSTGAIFDIDLPNGLDTLGEVIDRINEDTPDTIEARINDTGDGLLIADTSDGPLSLKIEDVEGGHTAADLRIAQSAKEGEKFIDGSHEIRIDVSASDSLEDLVDKINEAGGDFSASILNDHGSVNPYSLTITSQVAGLAGEMIVDTVGVDLGFDTLSRAQDALVSIGGSGASDPFLVSSSTNTLEDVIEGVSLNLLSAGDEDVTINVAQDIDSVVEAIGSLVSSYNDVQAGIDGYTSFDQDSLERGLLLGDSLVNTIRSRLSSAMFGTFGGGGGPYSRLFSVGIRVSADNRLEFDEEEFRQAYAEAPEQVEQLLTEAESGFGTTLKETLDEMTRDTDGLIARREDLLDNQKELLNDRIDSLNDLLDAKRSRLEQQFIGLETALANLQEQQTALSALLSLQNS
jgi:flagellar hook-associated protein 2